MNAKYNPENLSATANVFTTVYLGNYVSGDYSEGHGSHPGVDMIPARPNDDIHACLPGVIQFAGTNASNGNYVVVKHPSAPDPKDTAKTTTLYSCHLHLSALGVKTGDTVDEGDILGQTGSTGNSTGEHLHFQIDTAEAPFHPYWPFTYQDAKNAGLGFFDAVNRGLGLDNARQYTINPLVYIDAIELVRQNDTNTVPASVPGATMTSSFVDVDARTPYFEAIAFLAEKNIISKENDHFYPENNITRAELVKMVFGAGRIQPDTTIANPFTDINPAMWYAPYVATAKARGIIGGYADGTFKPNNPITRAEAFKIIINTLNKDSLDSVSFKVFDDVDPNVWYSPYANFAKTSELLHFAGNVFEPDRLIERAEVANAIYMLIK